MFKNSLVASLLLFCFGCSDSPKMETPEQAAFNDAIANCIYSKGNPQAGSQEYREVEDACVRQMR